MSELAVNFELNQTPSEFDLFWQNYGEYTGYQKDHYELLWNTAGGEYVDLPYHNFTHITETLTAGLELVKLCEGNDCSVDKRALSLAILFHDARYHEDSGDISKEENSANRLYELGESLGLTNDEVSSAQKIILATQIEAVPESIEEKIMLRADLNNIGQDYLGSFLYKNNLLREEAKLLQGDNFSELKFTFNSIKIIATYLNNDLLLGDFDKENWSEHALINLERFIKSVAAERSTSAFLLLKDLGSTALKFFGDKFKNEENC